MDLDSIVLIITLLSTFVANLIQGYFTYSLRVISLRTQTLVRRISKSDLNAKEKQLQEDDGKV